MNLHSILPAITLGIVIVMAVINWVGIVVLIRLRMALDHGIEADIARAATHLAHYSLVLLGWATLQTILIVIARHIFGG